MAIDPAALLAHDFGETRAHYTARDAILYALGVGLGDAPADLPFLDETKLAVLPTFAVTLATPGMWIRDPRFGVDFARLVHSEQSAAFHAPLPPSGEIVGTARVVSLTDRGAGKGAVLTIERTITDASDGTLYCTLAQTLLLRGDGGYGGPPTPRKANALPDRAPDATGEVRLSPRAALIYRLSGDWNPLHISPGAAAAAGFPRPIMHGLGVYGTLGVALCRLLGADPSTLRALSCRFAGIVYPGETLRLSAWKMDAGHAFAAAVGDRLVIDDGRLLLDQPDE